MPINVVAGESYWWCACGRSKTQPFCDGSHKGTEFRAAGMASRSATEEVWFCACKRSSTPAAVRRQLTRSWHLMPDLLLELFSEEIPARMQARAAEDLKKLVTDRLVGAGLVYEGAKAFVTPRRLALSVHGVPARQPDVQGGEEGPARRRAGAMRSRAFSKRAGLTSIDRSQGAARQEGRLLCRGDREAGPRRDRGDRRDPARGDQGLSVAEIDALGRAIESARRAQLGAAAAFDRRHVRAGDRGAGDRAVFGRRHRGRQRNPRPSLPGAGAVHGAPLRRLRAKARQGQGRARCRAPPRHHPHRRQEARLRAGARTGRGRRPVGRGRRPRRMAGGADGLVRREVPAHSRKK